MQTFLPFSDFEKSAKALDYRRLGKQRIEAYQIWKVLTGQTTAWKNHPAVKMWQGYEQALLVYQDIMIKEWINRGYKNTMKLRSNGDFKSPPWLGDELFHLSHQSNLIRKNPEYYKKIFGDVPNDMKYVWPV